MLTALLRSLFTDARQRRLRQKDFLRAVVPLPQLLLIRSVRLSSRRHGRLTAKDVELLPLLFSCRGALGALNGNETGGGLGVDDDGALAVPEAPHEWRNHRALCVGQRCMSRRTLGCPGTLQLASTRW